jgi:branched-chain amino acid transport system permease protein
MSTMQSSYRQGMRMLSSRTRIVWLLVFIAFALYLPTVLTDRAIVGYALSDTQLLGLGLPQVEFLLIAIIGAIALNLLVGYTGLLSLGHVAFFILGAMTAAQLDAKWGFGFELTIIGSAIVGAVVGALIGLVSWRVRGLYLLLSTLALHFIMIYVLLEYQKHFFGVAGMAFEPPTIGPITIDSDRDWYFFLLIGAILAGLITRNLLRSREGRAFVAVRDKDIAAASLGMSPRALKIKAFAVSSSMVTVAGCLYAYNLTVITSDAYSLEMVVGYYAMVIVGGMGTLAGPILGAIVWQLTPQILQTLSTEFPSDTPVLGNLMSTYLGQTSSLIFGVLIIVILIFKPEGLDGIWQSLRRSVTRWPYSV